MGRNDDRRRDAAPAGRSLRRAAGRLVIWTAIAVLLIRGAVSSLATPPRAVQETPRTVGTEDAVAATAERFARLYLEDPSSEALAPYLAAGASLGAGGAPSGEGSEVVQTEVVDSSALSAARVIVTVSCELRDSRTLYLAVPILRGEAGEAAVLGAPSMVAMPAPAGADPESPRPIAGPAAGAIEELVSKFVPAYVSAASSKELSYLLTPGAQVVPLGGRLELLWVGAARQIDDGQGPSREVLVGARLHEPVADATYPVTYRLSVAVRAGRWYVAAVKGSVS